MQFFPFLMNNYTQPTTYMPSFIQMMSLALSMDYKKYSTCVKVNELKLKQSKSKKIENTDTIIILSSEEQISQYIKGQKDEKTVQPNGKKQCEFEKQEKQSDKNIFFRQQQKKQFDKTQSQQQQLQVLKQFDQINQNQVQSHQKPQFQYLKQNKDQGLKQKNSKKIYKKKKLIKLQQKYQKQLNCHISTQVSLIQTVDLRGIHFNRFEIERKKQSLFSRMFQQQNNQPRKTIYQTRQRRQLKRLN